MRYNLAFSAVDPNHSIMHEFMGLYGSRSAMTYAKPNKLRLALPIADRRDARTAINWSVKKPRKRQKNWLFGKHNQDKTAGR